MTRSARRPARAKKRYCTRYRVATGDSVKTCGAGGDMMANC
jgi:hypothetical protein